MDLFHGPRAMGECNCKQIWARTSKFGALQTWPPTPCHSFSHTKLKFGADFGGSRGTPRNPCGQSEHLDVLNSHLAMAKYVLEPWWKPWGRPVRPTSNPILGTRVLRVPEADFSLSRVCSVTRPRRPLQELAVETGTQTLWE